MLPNNQPCSGREFDSEFDSTTANLRYFDDHEKENLLSLIIRPTTPLEDAIFRSLRNNQEASCIGCLVHLFGQSFRYPVGTWGVPDASHEQNGLSKAEKLRSEMP